jgi:hypothetical protein
VLHFALFLEWQASRQVKCLILLYDVDNMSSAEAMAGVVRIITVVTTAKVLLF